MAPNANGESETLTPSSSSVMRTPPNSSGKKKKNRITKSERKRRKRLREEAERQQKQEALQPSVSTPNNKQKQKIPFAAAASDGENGGVTSIAGSKISNVKDGDDAGDIGVAITTPTKSPNASSANGNSVKKSKKKKKKKHQGMNRIEGCNRSSNSPHHVSTNDNNGEATPSVTSTSTSTSTSTANVDEAASNNNSMDNASAITDTKITPTMKLITETSMREERSSVEFVFSSKSQMVKDAATCTNSKNGGKNKQRGMGMGKIPMIPYIHSKLRKSNISKVGNHENGDVDNSDDHGDTEKKQISELMDQGIDDILLPQRKKQRKTDSDGDGDGNSRNNNITAKSDSDTVTSASTPNQKKKKKKSKRPPPSDTEAKKDSNEEKNQLTTATTPEVKNKKRKKQPLDTEEEEADHNSYSSKSILTPSPAQPKEANRTTPVREREIVRGGGRSRSDSLSDPLKTRLSGRTVHDAINDETGKRPRSNSTDGELKLPSRGLCDERVVMKNYQWDADVFKKSHPRGLINLGNTCFLNSTLQCLAYLPTFCQCVANLPPNNAQSRGNQSPFKGKKSNNNNGLIMTQHLRSFVRKVHGLDGQQKQGPVKPSTIVRSISLLNGGNRGYKFRPGRQEDAHEFLVHLLDAMNNGELKAAGEKGALHWFITLK